MIGLVAGRELRVYDVFDLLLVRGDIVREWLLLAFGAVAPKQLIRVEELLDYDYEQLALVVDEL